MTQTRNENDCDKRKENPIANANCLSKMCFWWAMPLLKLGNERPLEDRDLYDLQEVDSSAENRKIIEGIWQQENDSKRNNLARGLLKNFLTNSKFAFILMFINMSARIAQAWVLGLLMEQFERFKSNDSEEAGSVDTKKGYLYASLLALFGLIAFPSKQMQFFETYRLGMQLRIGIIASIFAKALRLPAGALHCADGISNGYIMNLASTDVEKFVHASVTSPFLFLGPFFCIVILVIGILIIGPVFAIGYVLLACLIPLQIALGRKFALYRSQVAAITDERVNFVSQAISGVRIMKYYGWEYNFRDRIQKIRAREIATIHKAGRYKALNEAIFYIGSISVSVFIFSIYDAMGGELTPRKAFSTMTLLNIVQFILTKHVPNSVMSLSESFIASRRIQRFFSLIEQSPMESVPDQVNANTVVTPIESYEEKILKMSGVTCHWNSIESSGASNSKLDENENDVSPIAISDISLEFSTGKLYCIFGKVGSGKSGLLQCLAGELKASKGQIFRQCVKLSYAEQEPFIVDGTVKENILMGCDLDDDLYNDVIHACGLSQDLTNFVNGDDTLVGDRGLQLSGGQRARLGLARCLYQTLLERVRLLLLDDPLSAVDAKISRKLFYDAIQTLALKRGNCCVILVTHQLQFAGAADVCIVIDEGRVVSKGSYAQVADCPSNYIEEIVQVNNFSDDIEQEDDLNLDCCEVNRSDFKSAVINSQKEGRSTGVITLATWKAYFQAIGGVYTLLVFILLFSCTQASQLTVIVMIGRYSSGEDVLKVVQSLTFGMGIFAMINSYFSFQLLIKAAERLHNSMLESVLRSKICFFDTNPLGRIVNRFASDCSICDETLPLTIYDFSIGFVAVIGSIITAIWVLPFLLIVLPVLLFLFLYLRRIFVTTTRELKRLDGIGRSPIFAKLSEVLNGIVTIRSNDKVKYFSDIFEQYHDKHTRASFAFVFTSRWFAFQMDFLSWVLMACASILAVVFQDQNLWNIDPSVLGLALTLLIQISTTNFPWIVRQSAEVTNQMVSVERINEYGKLASEAALTTEFDTQNQNWPIDASIRMTDLSIRYREDLPLCLSNISFSIESGCRLAIVGRSGSGKSSLVQALFRVLECEKGTIEVGGVDIKTLGLHTLRKKMAIISQTPILIRGCSIQENLDPFGQFQVDDINEALESVQMLDAVNKLADGLNTMVEENGSNFSVGQRQLLSLARAILYKLEVLVLDEPTANVDIETDRLLQRTLRLKFSEATIIVIAHRLDTIVDFDKVLVLEKGESVEFGTPKELMSRDGHFASLVKSTGDHAAIELRAVKHQI